MTELFGTNVYAVCVACKKAKIDTDTGVSARWNAQHAKHGALELVSEQTFRSDHLSRGFHDVDRPTLKHVPMRANLPIVGGNVTPFGIPNAVAAARDLHHKLRREARAVPAKEATEEIPASVPAAAEQLGEVVYFDNVGDADRIVAICRILGIAAEKV